MTDCSAIPRPWGRACFLLAIVALQDVALAPVSCQAGPSPQIVAGALERSRVTIGYFTRGSGLMPNVCVYV
jgi:hypothetical protein